MFARLLKPCLIGAAMLAAGWPHAARAGEPVGLELVLLLDTSASVNDAEFRLQARGLAGAFASTGVLDAIRATRGGVAVSVIQWADRAHQSVAVEWARIDTETDALNLSARLAAMPRLIEGGHTALGNALEAGLESILENGYEGLRRVIDLSGDGRSNDGRALRSAREEVLSHGITINGLAILNELPLLETYFREKLIGGEGSFAIAANDYDAYEQAMIEKLMREIHSMPLTLDKAQPRIVPAGAY